MAHSSTSSQSHIEIKPKILTLPTELIEQILILTAFYGFPAAIAQLSCTCRYFHHLVYRSTDSHLWREVFLTTFDDPRLVLGRITSATTFSPGNFTGDRNGELFRTGEIGINWEREFIRRMDAVRIMKKYKDLGEEWNDTETNSEASVLSVNANYTYAFSSRIHLLSLQRSKLFFRCWRLHTPSLLNEARMRGNQRLPSPLYSPPTHPPSYQMKSYHPTRYGFIASSVSVVPGS